MGQGNDEQRETQDLQRPRIPLAGRLPSLVLLEGSRGRPESIELPPRLDSCAQIWPLRKALEREIGEHDEDVTVNARACTYICDLVLGWWVRLGEELACEGRKLAFVNLRPEFSQAMDLLRGALVGPNEIPQSPPNRRLGKTKFPG